MENMVLWAVGLSLGFVWFPFKLYQWLRPERVTRRDRVSERIAVPALLGLLILMWIYLDEKILSKDEGYQLLLSVTFGVAAWTLVVIAQWSQPLPPAVPPPETIPEPTGRPNTYAIDGSNIVRVNSGFSLEVVGALARALSAEGNNVQVFFDANIGFLAKEAGYVGQGNSLSVKEIADYLATPDSNVTVVPSGTAADPWILKWAKHTHALTISNDRYRDHQASFPDFDENVDRVTLTLIGHQIWLSDRDRPIFIET